MAAVLKTAGLTRDALVEATAASTRPGFDAAAFSSRTAVSDASALGPVIDAVLAANPQQVETYRGGKEGVLASSSGRS